MIIVYTPFRATKVEKPFGNQNFNQEIIQTAQKFWENQKQSI
jgi:hypothetical protein